MAWMVLIPGAAASPILVERFQDPRWHESWVDWRSADELNASIQPGGFRSSGLTVAVPPGWRRGSGPHFRFTEPPEELWFRYHLFLDDWRPIDSGKLPGPAGIYGSTGLGCRPSTVDDPGWSARMLFSAAGEDGAGPDQVRIGFYTYHLGQQGNCGEFMYWDPGVLDQQRWYCIQGHIRLNEPGASDGLLEGRLDGVPALRRERLAFRRDGEGSVSIRSFFLNVYFGGSSVRNDRELRLRIDQLVVDDEGPVPCLTRFTDDDQSLHQSDIEYLFHEGIVFGCAQNLFCPARKLTRGEMFAMLDRALDPPPATQDFFGDDSGMWYEAAANRLAAAGILAGCDTGRACGEAPVLRGQFAALLHRMYRFAPPEADFFRDDDRAIYEEAIDALASAHITNGCGPGLFCPYGTITRAQAATLLARSLRWAQQGSTSG